MIYTVGMKKLLLPLVVGFALFVSPLVVFADNPSQGPYDAPPTNILPSGVNDPAIGGVNNPTTQTSGTSHSVVNPLGVKSICGLIKALLGAAVAIGIPIAVLFIVWAGLKFVLARGNGEALAEARSNFLYTVIGIGIFLGAWLLAMVIVNTVNSLQAGSGQTIDLSCQ